MRNRLAVAIAAVGLLGSCPGPALAGSYSFTTIDPPGNNIFTTVYGINDVGQIVGYAQGSTGGFLYSGGTYTGINYSGAANGTYPFAINHTGQVVGQYLDDSFSGHAFLYSGGTFQTIDPPVSPGSPPLNASAQSINKQGQVLVGGYDNNGNFSNFLYANGQFTPLTALSNIGPVTYGQGINDAGTIVGYSTDSNNVNHGFILQGNQVTPLNDPNAANAPSGQVLGGTAANALNNKGEFVGYYADANGINHGFVYQNGVYTTLDDPLGVKGTDIYGVNDAGQIVGFYFGAHGTTHGFLATPAAVPEPGSLALVTVTGLAVAGWRLRKRRSSAPGSPAA